MTIIDSLITQFVNQPGVELNLDALSDATGLPKPIVSSGIYRMMNRNQLNHLVKTGVGAWTFRPDENTVKYKNSSDKLVELLKTRGSVTKEEIAKELDIHPNYVHELVCRVNKNRGLKAKREVRYTINKGDVRQ